MITTIAIAAATGFAGLFIGSSAASFGLRRRLDDVDGVIDEMQSVLVTRPEIGEALTQISAVEQQRELAIEKRLEQMAAYMTQVAQVAQAAQVQPTFRPGGGQSGAFQQPGQQQGASPSPAEVNAMLTQQLSAINQRLQQVTGQQMPS
jgi:hypothetical protein